MDWIQPPEIPANCDFLCMDILNIAPDKWLPKGPYDFIVASSPCDEFSKCGMPHMFPNAPYPELGIKLFNHTRKLCEASGVLWVLENVRAAQKFVGHSIHHCGPFYLWGSGVPIIFGQGITKGLGFPRDAATGKRMLTPYRKTGSKSVKARAELKARYATIPRELANCVAEYAERLLEGKAA